MARIADYLSRDERQYYREPADVVAFLLVLSNYAVIAAAFALFGLWPNPLTFVVSTLLLAGRYIGLGILNHDAAHNSLFKTRRLNRGVARWLFAAPTLLDYDSYRAGHLAHHKHAGTLKDPDIPFVRSYPVEGASMRRKVARDIFGRTGLRDTAFLLFLTFRRLRWRALVVHGALFGVLYVADIPWAYALWWVAMVFVVPVLLRIRVMGEHGNVPNLLSKDPRDHARTTRAGLVGRALVAPNYVNCHCEHHFFANVPGYKLPRLHRLLVERGFYDEHPGALADGYLSVIRECVGERHDRPDLGPVDHSRASLSNMV